MQKVELKVVGVLEVRIWGGAGVSVLVCRRGAAFEMDWWKCGCVSVDTIILHTFLCAYMHCLYCNGILEGTRLYNYHDGEGNTAPEYFGIYLFLHRT